MKILITGNVNGVVKEDFLSKFFYTLSYCTVDLNEVTRLHRLSRPGFEYGAFKCIEAWEEQIGSRVPKTNHTPFDTEGGKNARYVMHGDVITPENIDVAIVFADKTLDDHSANVVYWLEKRGIPYHVALTGVKNEAINITSHGFLTETSGEDLS